MTSTKKELEEKRKRNNNFWNFCICLDLLTGNFFGATLDREIQERRNSEIDEEEREIQSKVPITKQITPLHVV